MLIKMVGGVSSALNILSEREHFRAYKVKDIAGIFAISYT